MSKFLPYLTIAGVIIFSTTQVGGTMFKKIFGKRPRRSLTVQESLVVLLLLGVYVGLVAGVIGGSVGMVGQAVIDKQINGYAPYLSSWAAIALMFVLLALVSWATVRYLRLTEQRLVLADSVRTEIAIEDEGDHE